MEVIGQPHAPAALPSGKASGTHWIGGSVGPRTDLDAVVKGKIPCLHGDSNQGVAQRYTTELSRLLIEYCKYVNFVYGL